MVRAILRVWKDLDLTGLNERRALQDFLKRLLRLAPFVLFDAVAESELDQELRAVARESLDAQRRAQPHAENDATEPETVSDESDETPTTLRLGDAGSGRRDRGRRRFRSVEICAGAGAQALGLERAGFDPVLLIDSKADACFTIDLNRPSWDVICMDVLDFQAGMRPEIQGVDLLSAGLPRVTSVTAAGRTDDTEERRVLMAVVELAAGLGPKALLLENLPDLVESPEFAGDRSVIEGRLGELGYRLSWRVLNAVDYGVPQNRKSGFLVALQEPYFSRFSWPEPDNSPPPTVGQVLGPSMSSQGWPGAEGWIKNADQVAPSLVGGSGRSGEADRGSTDDKRAWAALGLDGTSLADALPDADFSPDGLPRLTIDQAAMIQMFPPDWQFSGSKASRYSQIGQAMPPPLATAVGSALAASLHG
jgi:site-specific DNA-cytosine methylase